jgi:serine/threonine-protein kinase
MSFCTKCGTSVTAGSLYCAICGSKVDDVGDSPTEHLRRRPSQESIAIGERRLLEALRSVTLGEYEILAEIGRGGMAVVFLAHDIALDRKVAIKVMSPALLLMDSGIQDRFKREARTAAALSHPHIIPVYAVKESEQIVYFVMKYIVGRSLEAVIKEVGALPIPMVQTILSYAGSALGYAHRKGVVHRDVKPGNIMLDEEGWVVVADFGIAKVTEAQALTMTGGVVGTPAYMSPEQCSAREITGASDQYSLGIVAYEMLTGRQPFESGTMVNMMYDHCHTPPPNVLDHRPDCPPEIAAAVMRMLEKEPAKRWTSIEDAVATIGEVSDSQHGTVRTQMVTLAQRPGGNEFLKKFQTPGSPVPPGPRTPRPPTAEASTPDQTGSSDASDGARRRRRAPWIGIGAVILLGAVGGTALLLRGTGADVPEGTPVNTTATTAVGEAPRVARLDLSPLSATLTVGETLALQAEARDSSGGPIGNVDVRFRADDSAVATVSDDGIVTAVSPGSARISASAGQVTSTIAVLVSAPAPNAPPRPASRPTTVAVDPTAVDIIPGESAQLRARVLDQNGQPMVGQTVRWVSANPGVASVTDDGRVTGERAGATTVTAGSGTRQGTVTITVSPTPAASVSVTPTATTLAVGDTRQLSSTIRDARGDALTDRTVTWRSDDPGIASVSPSGLAQAVAPGTTTIAAETRGVTGTATITVPAPVTPPTAVDPRPEIERVLEQYRRAIETEDIEQLKRAYPGMTGEQERAWEQFFGNATDFRAALNILDLSVDGASGRARVEATYEYRTTRQETQTFVFTAELRRGADGWRLTAVQ